MKARIRSAENDIERATFAGGAGPSRISAQLPDDDIIEVHDREAATAALGRRARVRGTLQREKLGDAVYAAGFSATCPDFRAADAWLESEVIVEGVLERSGELVARVAPDGAISQGTPPGTAVWLLRGCVVRRAQ